ncbi:MAG: Fur family transcriptional regulator [Candidatus Nanopelagicales bacterium]
MSSVRPVPPVPPTRQTRQRAAVKDLLDGLDGFRSAQQVHDLLRQRGDAIGLTTVYRSLQALAATGEVDLLVNDDGETVYRQCGAGHHHHLVCRSCGRTVEIAGPAVEAWAARMAADHGFADASHRMEVFGICARCGAQPGRS